MESLAADHKSTFDLVPMFVFLLLKHYDDSELKLQEIDDKLTTVGMKVKLEKYKSKLVQEPAIITAYLNPQIPKPTDSAKLKFVVDLVHNSLQRRYSAKVSSRQSIEQEVASNSLFAAMFQPQRGISGNDNEVNQYPSIDVVQSSGFINILSWWSARKELLPGHYQMAMDYHGTSATSMPSERVNSAAGREFTCTRQSLSSSVFIMTMCLRSWMNAGILKVPVNRAQAAAALGQDSANNVESVIQELEEEQEDWDEEILDDGVVQMLHNQFANLVFEASLDL
ncbi:unnamed protein product [Sphagnum balticum]